MTNPKMRPGAGINETDMPDLYSLMDCLMSTAMGEGWGLTTMEAMACGVASIVGRYSALGEWPRGAVHYVDITSFEVTDKRINTIGGVPDRAQFVAAIDRMYRDVEYRQGLAKAGVALVRDAKYSWKTIGDQFHLAILESVVANSNRSKQMGTEVPQA
jgi:glycosyltransferase involved in cell wall biosynthesis